MSKIKSLVLFGTVLGAIAVTAWVSPKVSRFKQIKNLLKENGLDDSKMEIDPGSFKMSDEATDQAVKDGTFVGIGEKLGEYLVSGSQHAFAQAQQTIVRLREEGAAFQETLKAEVGTDTPANDPVVPVAPVATGTAPADAAAT